MRCRAEQLSSSTEFASGPFNGIRRRFQQRDALRWRIELGGQSDVSCAPLDVIARRPGEVREPGVSPVSAAICNAIFNATGKRIRTLPVDAAQLKRA